MSNHTFTGVFIPAKIWVAEDLIPQEKMMLAEIKALSEDKGWCFANNSHFAKWLRCSTQNISNYIQRFQRDGMIEVTYADKKTFAGRKMRVNIEWFHGLATPYTGNVTPYTGNVTPYTGNVTEIQSKDTFKLNERGDAHAEISNTLEEEKNERGLVPPPPPAEAAAPDPTHMVTEIHPEAPHTRVVSPFTMPTRVDTTIEAEKRISEWIAGEGLETVKFRYETAKERFDPAQAPAIAAHYCSVYTKNPANKERLLSDPVTHFSDGLFSYIKSEQQYGRQRPQPGPAQSPNQPAQKSALPLALQNKIGR